MQSTKICGMSGVAGVRMLPEQVACGGKPERRGLSGKEGTYGGNTMDLFGFMRYCCSGIDLIASIAFALVMRIVFLLGV